MANFISNLIARHTTAASYVMPRPRGRFEPQPGPAAEAMPAWSRVNAAPSAEPVPAATDALPEPRKRAAAPPAPGEQERGDQVTGPPANRTVAPQETLLSLFTPSEAAHPAAHPSPENGGEQTWADNYPANTPIGGTVNNLFVNHPPPESSGRNTPSTPHEQMQPSTVRPLYFSIQPPGQQSAAHPGHNGNGSAGFPQWFNHFLPDRNMQRSGQNSLAASGPQPVIKVSIGRIDVRAVTQPAAAKPGTAGKAAMSLDDFLKKRSGGTS